MSTGSNNHMRLGTRVSTTVYVAAMQHTGLGTRHNFGMFASLPDWGGVSVGSVSRERTGRYMTV